MMKTPTLSVKSVSDADRPRAAVTAGAMTQEVVTPMRDKRTPDMFDLAWAAGLFEGEGCWTIQRNGRNTSVQAILTMTDFDVVRRFHTIVGIGTVTPKKTRLAKHHKPQLMWRVTDGAGVRHVYQLFKPWLGERRRARGAEVLRLHEEAIAATERRHREFCRNGHRRTAENTGTQEGRRGSARRCRECCAAANRRARAKKKLAQQAETMREVLS